MSCDHDFSVPLHGQNSAGEWTFEVVGWTCSKCWRQVFEGDPPIVWTTASNTIEYISIGWAG